MNVFLVSKCRICGKPLIKANNNLVCKECLQRRRNFKHITGWIEKVLYKTKEEQEEYEDENIPIGMWWYKPPTKCAS